MILRAVFWIAVVAVLIPREPDVGFGRPSVPDLVPPRAAEWLAHSLKVPACEDRDKCLGGLALAGKLHTDIVGYLQRAKEDLKAAEARPLSHLTRRGD